MEFFLILYLAGTILTLSWLKIILSRQRKAPLPPGPKGKPIIGNLADLPPPGAQEWVHWARHKDLYGPISSVTVLGQTLIILNDSRYAFELLEKRSARHSSRPKMVFGGEMVGWEDSLVMQPYGDQLRAYRRNAGKVLGSPTRISRFHELQDIEVRRFLLRVLKNQGDLQQHIRTEAGAIILKITYDYTINPHGNDPLVDLADEAVAQFALATIPGVWLVDIMPFLRYLPDWFPGMKFKQTARRWRKALDDVAQKPYSYVKQQMKVGSYKPSFVSELLQKEKLSPEEDFVIKWSAMSLYTGGADTTVSSIACFFLAMTLFPEVQRKAQEEIDRVIGPTRLPGSDDRTHLPYVDAIVKEVLRWHPVAPMGAAHMTTEDDLFEGYHIPKGAYIMPNIWTFFHDPETYRDPMAFRPERFLNDGGHIPEPDPHTMVFGFGRRICPGRHLADSAIYLTIAKALAAFNMRKLVENGKEVEPVVEFQNGVISHPVPFKINVKPRSADYETLIRSVESDHPWEEGNASALEGIV